jgi:NAD(P)-dependent dehydrogenase (short-subunit alcohol dehydrogenase family)
MTAAQTLLGKNALVTGSSRGIGRDTALALAREGANVVIHANKDSANAIEVVDEVKKLGVDSFSIMGDVACEQDVQRIFSEIKSRWHTLDILVNNAGIVDGSPAEEMPLEQWRRVVDVNLTGVFLCAQAAGRMMIAQKSGGSIINISSICGHVTLSPQNQCNYNASKGGVGMLTKSLAVEWAPHEIRVNAVSPGYISTDLVAKKSHLHPLWEQRIAMGRLGQPIEIGEIVAFLAGPKASFVTGADWVADGGHICW